MKARQPTEEELTVLKAAQMALLGSQVGAMELHLVPGHINDTEVMVIARVERIEEVNLGAVTPLAVLYTKGIDDLVEFPPGIEPMGRG